MRDKIEDAIGKTAGNAGSGWLAYCEERNHRYIPKKMSAINGTAKSVFSALVGANTDHSPQWPVSGDLACDEAALDAVFAAHFRARRESDSPEEAMANAGPRLQDAAARAARLSISARAALRVARMDCSSARSRCWSEIAFC